MNYSKIINNVAFAALISGGAFAGFLIGVKLPAVFASFYTAPADANVAAVVSPVIVEPIEPVAEIKPEIKPAIVPTKPVVKTPITAGQKTETLQLINSPVPVKDVGKPDL